MRTTTYNYLYGLTVQGIQSYIFDTNKLKEIIGASEIIEQICTSWFDDFIINKGINGEKYLNAAGNIRFMTDKAGAEMIYENYQKQLLDNAPGVPFSQAVVQVNGSEKDAIEELDSLLEAQRNRPVYEFDLGFMARRKNRRTGNAATTKKEKNEFLDLVTYTKQKNNEATALKDKTTLKDKTDIIPIEYPKEFRHITKNGKHSWMALIHIDGNGMGKRINEIKNGSDVLNRLKDFSCHVEEATIDSYKVAVDAILESLGITYSNGETIPLRPIVLGGDDLTVLIRADLALIFVKTYLQAFEEKTKDKLGKELTAAAGIVFMKEKFPFHYAVNLVEQLTSHAKNKSGRNKSSMHFYRIQDSFVDEYKDIIEKDLTANAHSFVPGPYYPEDEPKIDTLMEEIKELQSEDAPTNAIREWVDLKFNNEKMAEIVMGRMKHKYGENITDKTQFYIDYLSLLAVGTKIQ